MKTQSKNSIFIILIIFISFIANKIYATSFVGFVPETVTQPTGEQINLYRSGDIFYNWLHDINEFTVIQDSTTGFWCWAKTENGDLVSTGYPIHQHTPSSHRLKPKENISTEKYREIREYIENELLYPNGAPPPVDSSVTEGEFDHIVVFIRFADEDEDVFRLSKTKYLDLLNNGEDSVQRYYLEASYGNYHVTSHLFPPPVGNNIASYQSVHPRSVLEPLLPGAQLPRDIARDAFSYIKQYIPHDLRLDLDDDTYIDNVTFIFSASDKGKNHHSLWPYSISYYFEDVSIHNKHLLRFCIMNEWSVRMTGNGGILEPEPPCPLGSPKGGLIVHEMSHSLGIPDLYVDYFRESNGPVGLWDPMSTGNHYSTSMTAHIKHKYTTWIDNIPWITESGVYTLNPITSPTNNAFRIASPYAASEYFVVEYRNNSMGWMDANVPDSGLLVYRVKPVSWGNHHYYIHKTEDFEIYVFRPDGTYTYPYGEFSDISNATFSIESGRTAINHFTNPSPFLSNGLYGGLDISNIGSAGDTISFTVTIVEPVLNVYVYSGYSYIDNYFDNIQEAIESVHNGGTVHIYPGRYSGEGNVEVKLPYLKKINITSKNNDPNSVIIDCEDEFVGFIFDNNNTFSRISDITIVNSTIAIQVIGEGYVVIDNVIFDATESTLSVSRGINFTKQVEDLWFPRELNVTNSIFKGFTNTAIFADTRILSINNCVFESNSSTIGSAIDFMGGDLQIKDSVFSNNAGMIDGATINIRSAVFSDRSIIIEDNIFINNKNMRIGTSVNPSANISIYRVGLYNLVLISSNVFIQDIGLENNSPSVRIYGLLELSTPPNINYFNNTEIGFGYTTEGTLVLETPLSVNVKNSIFTGLVRAIYSNGKIISNSWFFDAANPSITVDLDEYIKGFSSNNRHNIFTGNPHLDPITYAPLWNERRKSRLINAANIDTNGNGIPWWEDENDTKPDGTNLDIGAVQSNRNQKYIKHELERDTYHWVAFPYLDMFYKEHNEDYPHLRLEYIFQNHHFNNLLSISPRYIDEIEWNYNDISGKVFYGSRGWNGDMNHLIDIKHGYKIKTTDIHYDRPFITSGFYYGNDYNYYPITLQAREAGTSYREIWLGYFGQNGHYVFDLFEDILDDIVEIKTQYWSVSRVPKTPNDWYISQLNLTTNFWERTTLINSTICHCEPVTVSMAHLTMPRSNPDYAT